MSSDETKEIVRLYVMSLTAEMLEAGIFMFDYRELGINADSDIEAELIKRIARDHPEDALQVMQAFYQAAADICKSAIEI